MISREGIYIGHYKLNLGRVLPILAYLGMLIFIVWGCKKEETPRTVNPSNLTVTLTEDPDKLGLVSIKATADNTNFYSFSLSENGNNTYEENTTGEYSYQYTTSGNHSIRVRAHAVQSNFIETTKVFTVDFDTSGGGGGKYPASGYETPDSYSGYNLVWRDEFDGTSVDESKWNFETGTGNNGWGNAELQYYLKENTEVENGILTITARKQNYNTSSYTSSRLTTENKASFKYGRIDIRAAMPYGQGMWPALWMLGENIRTVSWPACGEIDVMEMVGGNTAQSNGDYTTHGTLHWQNMGTHAEYGEPYYNSAGRLHDSWHVYTITWDQDFIRWYFDDTPMHAIDIRSSEMSEFHNKFFFIMNVAVGGNWPGSPDPSTVFPQMMHVDYIRVFQKQ